MPDGYNPSLGPPLNRDRTPGRAGALAACGEHSSVLLFARLWETLLDGALKLLTASFFFPLRELPDA